MDLIRWQTLIERLLGALPSHVAGADYAPIEPERTIQVYRELIHAYAEPHRFYHTGKHIQACLHHLDAARELAHKPSHVEAALWFHDAIYHPLSSTNERDSAQWAARALAELGVDHTTIHIIHTLIMVTEHNSQALDHDQKLITDIDLSILGAPREVYREFEYNVRQEYKHVPKWIFNRKRKSLLKHFLTQPQLYHFDYFRNRLENQAKENVAWAMAKL